MILAIDISGKTEQALAALAFVTGRPIECVVGVELAGALALIKSNHWELLSLAIHAYCDGPVDRLETIARFRQYLERRGLDVPDYEIEEELAEAGRG